MTILIVEDDVIDLKFLTRSLSSGKSIPPMQTATDGHEALNYLQNSNDVRLIILDLNMPGMNGKTLLSTLKSDPDLRRIPVLILSTSDDRSDIKDCYDKYANAYLTKPDTLEGYRRVAERINGFWLGEACLGT